jgi:5-oxoprolinase (ATP-hydrolysing)
VDFTGSGAVHPGNLNANRAIVASAVIYCLRCLLGEPIPLNAGLLAPVEIIIPPGTLLDPAGDPDPRRCPAVGGGNVETSQRLVDVILGALDLAAASQGTMNNLLFGRGDCAAGPAFGYYETIGGGAGAGPGFAGAGAVHVHMTNTRLTDPEVLECRYPVRLREWSIRRGSGGAGEFPGGDGMVREMEFLAALDVSLLTSRRTTAPYGAHGGEPGQPGRNLLRRAGAADFSELPPAVQINVGPGDVLRIETPGGGGWGESSILSPEKCLARRHAPRNH